MPATVPLTIVSPVESPSLMGLGCSSGFAYPSVNVIVFAFAKVTALSAVASGVPDAPEVAPVTALAPLKAT